MNAFKDVGAGMRNSFAGRAKSYENELASGVSAALAEMEQQAAHWALTRWSGRHRLRDRGDQHADGQRLRDGGQAEVFIRRVWR